jgi:trigger factor
MNINKEQINDLNLVVSMNISKDDYEPKVNEVLRDYRRKANMPGFRPGKIPEGLVRKMYGKHVLVDEINKLVSESLQKYINDEQLQVLGDPMPKTSGDDMEWEIGNDYTFGFEIGLAPAIDAGLSKNDKMTRYLITVGQDMVDKAIENHASHYGQFIDAGTVTDFKERLTGDIVQLGADSEPLPDGLAAEDTSIMLSLIKDEDRKKPFEQAKAGGEIIFNLSETFPNDWEIASILKKKDKEDVGDISASLFRFTVKNIQVFAKAEVDQDLFDKVFGEGAVKSAEEFEERIKESIAGDFKESSMAKFGFDAREYLLDKLNPPMPEEFLRKWLWAANKDKVDEAAFDKEFPAFLKSMKWELITQAIAKQNDFKVEEQEIIDFAKEATKRQFAQYGITNFPDDMLANYAMGTLKEEKNIRQIASQVIDKKVIDAIHDSVDVSIQEMSLADFNKMIYPEANNENVA